MQQGLSPEEIKKISIDPFFEVYYYNAFKYIVKPLLESNGKHALLMVDINNLYKWNKEYTEKNVNIYIKEIIEKIKRILGGREYEIAKLGDEIYIYINDCTDQEISIIQDDIKKIEVKGINGSVGYSRIGDNNLGKGADDAEINMQTDKEKNKMQELEKKIEELKKIIQENNLGLTEDKISYYVLKEIIWQTIKDRFAKSRFNINIVDDSSDKLKFNPNEPARRFKLGLRITDVVTKERIHSNTVSKEQLNEERAEIEKEYSKYEEKYKERSIKIYGEENREYIFGQLITHDVEEECVSHTYFQNVMLPKKIEEFPQEVKIISIKMSGIKQLNDKYGHEVCDKRIRDMIKKVKTKLKKNKIIRTTPIVIRGAEDIYMGIKDCKNIERFVEDINQMNDGNKELVIYAINSEKGMKKCEGENGIKQFNRELYSLSDIAYKGVIREKARSLYHLAHFTRALLKAILNNPIVKSEIERDSQMGDKIRELVKEDIKRVLVTGMTRRKVPNNSYRKNRDKNNYYESTKGLERQ